MPHDDRLKYLCYRCHTCGRLITKLEILDIWKRNEEEGIVASAVCKCGGNRLSPTNPLLWEEVFLPRVWRLWFVEVVLPWLRK